MVYLNITKLSNHSIAQKDRVHSVADSNLKQTENILYRNLLMKSIRHIIQHTKHKIYLFIKSINQKDNSCRLGHFQDSMSLLHIQYNNQNLWSNENSSQNSFNSLRCSNLGIVSRYSRRQEDCSGYLSNCCIPGIAMDFRHYSLYIENCKLIGKFLIFIDFLKSL